MSTYERGMKLFQSIETH